MKKAVFRYELVESSTKSLNLIKRKVSTVIATQSDHCYFEGNPTGALWLTPRLTAIAARPEVFPDRRSRAAGIGGASSQRERYANANAYRVCVCPRCASTHNRKNGRQRGKQNYICVECGREFIESYEPKGYSEDLKRECLEMYVNGSGFRAIERVKKVHHTTVISWVNSVGSTLPDAPEYYQIPEVTEVDELETFIGSKKTLIWLTHLGKENKPAFVMCISVRK